ncbi:MAG: helix-turn-helix domain-containing protein [Nanoarchaeota archaeon]|nr:helix-turn-helix domain-containing protein [Nanoarchaeota archaeon]
MWVAKFKIKHDDWILNKTVKYNVVARGVPLNSYVKKGKHFHTGMVFLYGSEKDKKKFITSVKNDKRVKKCSVKGSQLFVLIEGKDSIAEVFEKSLFFIQPVLMKDGFEYWELGSWEKKLLIDFFDKVKKIATIEMLKIKRESPSVFIQQEVPKLTDKQRKVLEWALDYGYYKYPRKVSIKDLASKVKMPRTTFQEHLRKAEERFMNLLIEPLK